MVGQRGRKITEHSVMAREDGSSEPKQRTRRRDLRWMQLSASLSVLTSLVYLSCRVKFALAAQDVGLLSG